MPNKYRDALINLRSSNPTKALTALWKLYEKSDEYQSSYRPALHRREISPEQTVYRHLLHDLKTKADPLKESEVKIRVGFPNWPEEKEFIDLLNQFFSYFPEYRHLLHALPGIKAQVTLQTKWIEERVEIIFQQLHASQLNEETFSYFCDMTGAFSNTWSKSKIALLAARIMQVLTQDPAIYAKHIIHFIRLARMDTLFSEQQQTTIIKILIKGLEDTIFHQFKGYECPGVFDALAEFELQQKEQQDLVTQVLISALNDKKYDDLLKECHIIKALNRIALKVNPENKKRIEDAHADYKKLPARSFEPPAKKENKLMTAKKELEKRLKELLFAGASKQEAKDQHKEQRVKALLLEDQKNPYLNFYAKVLLCILYPREGSNYLNDIGVFLKNDSEGVYHDATHGHYWDIREFKWHIQEEFLTMQLAIFPFLSKENQKLILDSIIHQEIHEGSSGNFRWATMLIPHCDYQVRYQRIKELAPMLKQGFLMGINFSEAPLAEQVILLRELFLLIDTQVCTPADHQKFLCAIASLTQPFGDNPDAINLEDNMHLEEISPMFYAQLAS